jgi:hypothetical protein
MPFELNPRRRGPLRARFGWKPTMAGVAALVLLAAWIAGGCAEERPTGPPGAVDQCVACHASRERLAATAAPDTIAPPADPEEECGGSAPRLEAWERALVTGEYLGNPGPHGGSCSGCHGGRAHRSVKGEAHAGITRDPSAGPAPACRICHAAIVTRHAASLHGTQNGYQTMFALRGAQPAGQVSAMFAVRCASCHTSCGQCHVSRPDAAGGGLVSGHRFRRVPSMDDNCAACHSSRVGAEFRGENRVGDRLLPGDAHYLSGETCVFCHPGTELHGDGGTPSLRYEAPGAPSCTECHSEVETDDNNHWHVKHGRTTGEPRLACQVCHSQPYRNCFDCHVGTGSQGLQHPSRIDFRIARNPARTARRPWDLVVVRHVPVSPASFDAWGVSLGSYGAEPTWRFATPHNIARRTAQAWPEGYGNPGVSCGGGCHGRRELFLTPAYLDTLLQEGLLSPAEVPANQRLTVEP